ncbi:MAG TPA: NAD(P)H-dependent oxidoreductase [Spirochaetota bacterium]|nr:NAD(P)H-dependent oxidoreductase [Spirochaetota bacterium]HPK55956.1 NAD(P)H-dependent oxidoreductase [Spirochaetota bacterium]
MKASVILAHPYEKSFNHAIFNRVCCKLGTLGVELFAHDLYAEKFNPVITCEELGSDQSSDPLVNRYADELLKSDIIIFIHPNWWGQPPAILKGYIDRVIRPPHAYDFPAGDSGGGLPVGKLKGKTGVVLNTSNTEEDRENNYFHDPLENIWKQSVFAFCGIEKYYRRMFRIIADSNMEERKEWLAEAESIAEKAVKGII